MKWLLSLFLLVFLANSVLSQGKRLVVLGSSTAAGDPTPADPAKAWVSLLHQHYKSEGTIDSTFNLAIPGTNPYIAMPTGYVPPSGRSVPNPNANITKAIDTQANIVIVSFVSNNYQVGGLSTQEIKTVLHTIKQTANDAGIVCFITTTQPRTGFNEASRQRLEDLKDSIINWFGFYAINFFDPLVNPVDNTIKAEYQYSGDQIHINEAGHQILFEQVLAKNIVTAALPVRLL